MTGRGACIAVQDPTSDGIRPAAVARRPRCSTQRAVALLLLLCTGSGLAEEPDATATGAVAPAPPYHAAADVHEMMALIIDPAADRIWDSAGTIITAAGSKELAPTTDRGWMAVLRAAAILTEAGNLLMMPGRAAGEDWIAYSRQLVDTGALAMQAAQARDADALFDAGGRIYQVCRGCHEQYWVQPGQP